MGGTVGTVETFDFIKSINVCIHDGGTIRRHRVSVIHLNKLINLTFGFLGFHLRALGMNHVREVYVYMWTEKK